MVRMVAGRRNSSPSGGPSLFWCPTAPAPLSSRRDANPPALDARLVRAHVGHHDADAERGSGVAGRQRRPAPSGLDRRSDPGARPGARHARTAGHQPAAGGGRPLGDDIPAPDRAARGGPGPAAAALGDDRRRRLRSKPGHGGLRGSRLGRRRDRPGRRRRHVPRADSRPRGGNAARGGGRLSFRDGDRFHRTAPRAVSSLAGDAVRLPNRPPAC